MNSWVNRAEFIKGYPLLTPNDFFFVSFVLAFVTVNRKKG